MHVLVISHLRNFTIVNGQEMRKNRSHLGKSVDGTSSVFLALPKSDTNVASSSFCSLLPADNHLQVMLKMLINFRMLMSFSMLQHNHHLLCMLVLSHNHKTESGIVITGQEDTKIKKGIQTVYVKSATKLTTQQGPVLTYQI